MSARIAVIYYSASGNVHRLAQAIAEGAEHAGGEVRLAMSRSSRPSS